MRLVGEAWSGCGCRRPWWARPRCPCCISLPGSCGGGGWPSWRGVPGDLRLPHPLQPAGRQQHLGSLLAVLVLLLLDIALGSEGNWKRKKLAPSTASPATCRWYLLAGLVLGLSIFFYTAPAAPLLVAGLCRPCLAAEAGSPQRTRFVRRPKAGSLALLVVAFLVTAGPMLSFAATHPDEWNARVNQVGILQSGWLEREPGMTGKSTSRSWPSSSCGRRGPFMSIPTARPGTAPTGPCWDLWPASLPCWAWPGPCPAGGSGGTFWC